MITNAGHLENLLPEIREVLFEDDEERIKCVKSEKFIMYDRAEELIAKMEELLEEPKTTRMPCMLIVGESNNGKTSVIKKFERAHPPTDGTIEDAVPVVSVVAPAGPDSHTLYDKILTEILIPFRHGDPISKKEMEIRYHFDKLGTKVLIIDEIHNVLSGSFGKQRFFMNTVKNLSIELAIPIVLAGTKDALNATNTDAQISSRFRPAFLPRWKYDEHYLSLLADIEPTLPLKKPSNLAAIENIDLSETIYGLSDGLIGETVTLINKAAIQAIKSGSERVTLKEIEATGPVKPSERRTREALQNL